MVLGVVVFGGVDGGHVFGVEGGVGGDCDDGGRGVVGDIGVVVAVGVVIVDGVVVTISDVVVVVRCTR